MHIIFEVFIYTLTESIMDLVITDILILSKKERAPDHFTTVCLTFMIHSLLKFYVTLVRTFMMSTVCG